MPGGEGMSYELSGLFAALPRTARGYSTVISGKEDKKNFLYTHGTNVFIRNIEDPAKCDVYSEHSSQTTVAKYSPSGYYIASGDSSGKIRIWDTVNAEHILKNEFQPIAGPITDIDWSGDSQRMVVGGQGREKFSHVFSADTGTSIGELIGHSKPVNSVAFRADRPYRVATGSEDKQVCFYHGPPFKLALPIMDHQNFVNSVRYAPDGSKFVTASSDGRAYVYDGKTGEKLVELGPPAHKGGVYSCCFSPNSKEILTVSGDKTAKIWNAETGELVVNFVMGQDVNDMQLGCHWQGEYILTVSLTGNINYLDRNDPSSPARVIHGHSKQITAMVCREGQLYSADGGGTVCVWDVNTGVGSTISGPGHKVQIQSISLAGDKLTTCSIDDTVKEIDVPSQSFSDVSIKMGSQPQGVATSDGGYTAVACIDEIVLLRNGVLVCKKQVTYGASCIAINPGENELAVGSSNDTTVHVYSIQGGDLVEGPTMKRSAAITCLAYSPDGAYLAAGDTNRKVALYSCPGYEAIIDNDWSSHSSRVVCLAWSPNGAYIASGGVDTNIVIWDVSKRSRAMKIERAHRINAVSAICWMDDNNILSGGHDACIRHWKLTY